MLGNYNLLAFVLTSDAARAKNFYAETLGLTLVGQDGHAVIFDAHGTMLRVTIVPDFTPSAHTIVGWIVPDIRIAAADLVKAGVKFEKYSFLEQDELGIWNALGGAAKVAWFKDPDGNVLSISQH
jgi:catechol 2,3-dioxygenase-like lactoylglutathione lyase family enzyme